MPRFVNHIAQGLITRMIRGNWFDLSSRLYTDSFMTSVLPQRKHHLWIIAAPKSGSTWLSVMLEELLGWPLMPLVSSYERREQEIEMPAFFGAPPHEKNVLSQHQHCRRSRTTLEIIEKTGMRCVLTTRNIFDTVVSFRDHVEKVPFAAPEQFMNPESWSSLSDDERTEFIVTMVMPWYFNFYAGWFDYLAGNPHSGDMIRQQSYEDLLEDPAGSLEALCRWAAIPVDPADIRSAVELSETKFTRKNKGIVGRGNSLADVHRDRIRRMAEYYPSIDFTSIGL